MGSGIISPSWQWAKSRESGNVHRVVGRAQPTGMISKSEARELQEVTTKNQVRKKLLFIEFLLCARHF